MSILTTVVLSSLAGCGSKANSSSGTTKPGEKIELSFMDWETPEMNKKMMEAIKDFETENPGVTVKQIPAPIGDYGLKLNQMIAANAAPSIFQAGQWTYSPAGLPISILTGKLASDSVLKMKKANN